MDARHPPREFVHKVAIATGTYYSYTLCNLLECFEEQGEVWAYKVEKKTPWMH